MNSRRNNLFLSFLHGFILDLLGKDFSFFISTQFWWEDEPSNDANNEDKDNIH